MYFISLYLFDLLVFIFFKLYLNYPFKKHPDSFYIYQKEAPIEKCNLDSFYISYITNHKPCIVENQKSSFFEKTNFVLNKSKILDEGLLELKKLIDKGNLKNYNPFYIKKDLLGVINMLGNPKFSDSLKLEDMDIEFV